MVVNKRRPDLSEIGQTGVIRFGNQVDDEELSDLRGARRIRTIRQMMHNDATIGALLFGQKMMLRQIRWRVDPSSPNAADMDAAEFIGQNMHDMSMSWGNTISDIVSFLPWGYSFHETVYKFRDGDSSDPSRRSRYTDGRVGWRKLPIRRQETHVGWIFDESGGIQAFQQRAAPDFSLRTIPIEKALLFQTENAEGNPEGYSILRNAYRSWRMKTNLENIEGIGAERDLVGYPIGWMPSAYMSSEASPEEVEIFNSVKDHITNIRRDDQEGAVMPLEYDKDGNKLFDITLLQSGGTRQFNTDTIIQRYDQRILMSVLADFLMLGSKEVGSFALSSDKTDLWSLALGTWADGVCDVFNSHGIPRLLRYNGMNVSAPPRLAHEDIESPDLGPLGEYILRMMSSGAITYDPGLEGYVRSAANLPALPEDQHSGQDQ